MEKTHASAEISDELPVCVVGAGSSGIVAVKVLREHGVPVVCFEKGSGIGGNWRYRNDNEMSAAYRSLHINTSKDRMAYSDFPMPESYPDYPHHSQILDYFEDYVDHFGIRDAIRFRKTVLSVEPAGDEKRGDSSTRNAGAWKVTVQDAEDEDAAPETHYFAAVLVANGHHWAQRWPDFPGDFDGEALHAHEYRTPEIFEQENVCVVGIGNSATDISCEASRVAKRTWLSTRRSAHILPKYAFGLPIDHLASPLGSRLPLWMQSALYRIILRLSQGPQERFGVPEPDHGILQAHPTISAELLNLVGHGKIEIKPNVERLDGDGIVFEDGSREEVDVLVYCTGYYIRFPFLDDEIVDPEKNVVRLYRHVVHPEHPGLYFIGLIQPLGAIMPLAEKQSEWVARLLTGETTLPDRETMEREIDADRAALRKRYVKSDRHTIQVDFFPYQQKIEKEMSRPA